jgi:tetratricopeptide (TPR) repeat protein
MPSCLTGKYRDMLGVSEVIAEIGQTVGDARLLAAAGWMRGYGLVIVGAPGEARHSLKDAAHFFESTGDKWWLAQATCQTGRTYLQEGELEPARAHFERTLQLFEEIHDQAELAWAQCYRGDASFVSGDWAEARRHYEESASLARTTVPRFYSHALLHLGELSLLEGTTVQAMEAIRRGLAAAEQCSEVAGIRKAQRLLAEQDLAVGDPDAAVGRLEPLLDGLQQGSPHAFPPTVLVEAYLAVDDPAPAAELVLERVATFRQQKRIRPLTHWLRMQGKVELSRGSWNEAHRAYEEAASLARGIPYPHAEALALHELGLLNVKCGDAQDGRDQLERALATLRRLGARRDAERIEHEIH